jgi:hypothetical protein
MTFVGTVFGGLAVFCLLIYIAFAVPLLSLVTASTKHQNIKELCTHHIKEL